MSLLTIELASPPERRFSWGTLASIALHAGLALALLLLSPLRQMVAPPPEPLAVEIVTPAQFAALQPAQPSSPPAAALSAPSAVATTPTDSDRLAPSPPQERTPPQAPTITATQLYSAGILKEPGMERIRQTMKTLADSEKLMQLCNIEGLEQIRRAAPQTDPDTLVPYAMADLFTDGLTLTAAGGAFRSRRKWYGVSFRCTVAPTLDGVTAFAFELGDAIPPEHWEEHNLNAADEEE